MNILGIHGGLCSGASLFQNDRIIAAVHEERFSRKKNDEAFPLRSIDYCLSHAGILPEDLDGVALASFHDPLDDILYKKSEWSIDDYLEEQYERWRPYLIDKSSRLKTAAEIFPDKLNPDYYIVKKFPELLDADREKAQKHFAMLRKKTIALYLGISEEKIHFIEHHKAHAAYSYYASPFRNENILAMTVDGFGDGVNATIGMFDEKGNYSRFYDTDQCGIARIYRYMTLLLGMKPNEHEFKVMGLASYGKKEYAKKALEIFKSTIYVDGIEFKWNTTPEDSYFWFKERLEGVRFDNVACGLQLWVEELLCKWVKNTINKYGVKKVVLAGGVAMNIKAMGKLTQLDNIESLFVGGSASDESLAIGSAFCLADEIFRKSDTEWNSSQIKSLNNLYLGPDGSSEEKKLIKNLDSALYQVIEDPSVDTIADYLLKGKVVARCAGRMEFGQRALGNRSILADPVSLHMKDKINTKIKNRDFWMPFAPIIMDEYAPRYIVNPKEIKSPHMTIGFDTTDEGYQAMVAACHPADRTVRAQILDKKTNLHMYELFESFSSKSGRGAILNTSFNLHGFPIVNTPNDALYVFEKSGLDCLWLNNYLVIKNDSL